MSNAFSLRCIYLSCKVLYFILSDDDFEIKSKIYSFNRHVILKHILHSQDVIFRNLLFTMFNSNINFTYQCNIPIITYLAYMQGHSIFTWGVTLELYRQKCSLDVICYIKNIITIFLQLENYTL